MSRSLHSLAAVAATLLVVAACADAPTTPSALPPSAELTLASQTAELRPGTASIVAIASGDTAFTTLVAAVVAAELVDALSGTEQLTVFAPTNAAFAKLGLDASNVGTLGKEALTDILLYHVTEGRRGAVSVINARRITMLNGDAAKVRSTSEGVFLNDSKVIATNISASNGIVHVIDSVLLPPQE
jgi:transforming growth factor-beta-induced protein